VKLHVLGSAAGGGYPQWNCNCRMCAGVRNGSIQATPRTQSSIAISDDGIDWALFNTSPDILQQLKSFSASQPARTLRDTGIQCIFLLDAQIDHTTGLLMLREHNQPLNLFTTAPVHEDLGTGNPLLKVLDHYCGINWTEVELDNQIINLPGAQAVNISPIPLTSNAPPYSPRRDNPVPGDTLGVLMHDTQSDKKLFYAPGLGTMESAVWDAMQQADVVLVDGTMWTDDEMIKAGASKKTAASMGHLAQSGSGGMIEWLDKLPTTTRKVLIHINNTNPILNETGPERAILSEHGIEVAEDGMTITLENDT